jgi:hypothetical protein
VQVERIAAGLWRWTGRIDGNELASLYVESEHAISLLDPVLPPEERERFLRALDRDVTRHGGPVHVFFSSTDDERYADELVTRYGAAVQTTSTDDVEIAADGFRVPAFGVRFAGRELIR